MRLLIFRINIVVYVRSGFVAALACLWVEHAQVFGRGECGGSGRHDWIGLVGAAKYEERGCLSTMTATR